MNKKVISKIVVIFILMALCLLFIGKTSMAKDYLSLPEAQSTDTSDKAKDITGMVLAVVQAVGISAAVIMLIVLGIKYMSAAPNDRAEIKKHMVVYVVGAILLFAASTAVGIIRTFTKQALGEGGKSGESNTVAEEEQKEQEKQEEQQEGEQAAPQEGAH